MPELPDIRLYVTRLCERLCGSTLESIALGSPFVLRSVSPKPAELFGKEVKHVSRLGKRLVLELEDELFAMIHLMIAGRLQWVSPAPEAKRPAGKAQLAIFRFSSGQLTLVENSTKKRAAISLIRGREALEAQRREGVDPTTVSAEEFAAKLAQDRRTLKRALTDPSWFDGIGNAYSDEILFGAKLSPMRLTSALSPEETARLASASREVLEFWTGNLTGLYPGFPRPTDVTSFRPEFNVHGKFGKPCNVCGAPVQHIVYADKETNYCAICQNEGRLLADRSLSRLLKDDWPKMLKIDDGGD
jgi:formamidopyrimidine-DNA glycosylase